MDPAPKRRRVTVQEYYSLGEAGLLRPDERTELIRGEIYLMPPISPRHAEGGSRVQRSFHGRVGDRAAIRGRNPTHLPDDTEPEPDVVLARPRADSYATAHPRPEDVLLVVEVSDTTLRYDREVKLRLYAAAGIPEVWLMDLPGDRIEVHRDPSPEGYRSITLVPHDGAVTPLAFPDVRIPCAEHLP